MKNTKKIFCCISLAICFICMVMAIMLTDVVVTFAYSGIPGQSQYNDVNSLFSATNTFSCSNIDKTTNPDRIDVTYNLSSRNGLEVMDKPQITVLTHGWASHASTWSNQYSEHYTGQLTDDGALPFAYDPDSLIIQLSNNVGGANIYWADMNGYEAFDLIDITNQTDQNQSYQNTIKVDNISDISKHIIIVFDGYETNGSHNNLYYQFNYMLSSIVNDVKILNGGILPKVNLIGHSRGGITNMQYALDHPDMVASLISMGTPYFGSTTALIAGESLFGESNGLDDILNPQIYYGLSKRWNDNYERLYSNINAVAIGGYSTLEFFNEVANNDFSNFLPEGVKTTIEICEPILSFTKRIGIIGDSTLTRIIHLFSGKFNNLLPESKVAALFEVFVNEIKNDAYPPYVSLYNDVLVHLDSQLAEDHGSLQYGGGTYNGFKRYTRRFTSSDTIDYSKVASAMPPVVHNLEPRDQTIINLVLSEVSLGVIPARFGTRYVNNNEVIITGYNNPMARKISIPDEINGSKVVGIATNAFLNCNSEYIEIPTTVKSIDNLAFANCVNLKEVNFQEGSELSNIGVGAFMNCTQLLSINLPNVKSIDSYAFYGCHGLTGKFVLPISLEYLGVGVFADCDQLTGFSISSENQSFTVLNGVLYNKAKTNLVAYPNGKNDTTYTVASENSEISAYAFFENQYLSSVNFNNVSTIREYAFSNCANLETIISDKVDYVDNAAFEGTKWLENNANFAVVGNALYKCQKTEADLNLSGYFSVSPFALLNNTSVETVTFNNAARTIGAYAFLGCENLNSVYLNNLNNMIYVGTGSFNETSDNLNIYMPQRVLPEYESNELWQQYEEKITVHSTDINFVLGGGNVDGQTSYIGNVQYGGYLSLPEPERKGYKFDGWYNSENFSGDQILNEDLWTSYADSANMYAKWTPITYSIIYDANGGNVDSSVQYYTIEDNVTYILPQRVGYAFEGWYYDEALTEPAGKSFAAGNIGDIRLYASWTPNNYVVTYNYNLKEGESLNVSYPEEASVTFGQTYSLVAPERYGYVFNGWKDSNGKFYSNEEGEANLLSWDFAGDITLYADWTLITYTIKIDDDGIIYYVGPNGNICETEVQIPSNMILNLLGMIENYKEYARNLRVGHKFAYFTDENGDKITSWSNYLSNIKIGETIVLNAYYEVEQNFTIDFIGETTTGVGGPFIGQFESKINYAIASKEGYTFKYWFVADTPYNNDYYDNTALAPGEIFDYTLMPDLSVGKEEDGYHIYLEAYFEPNEYFISLHSEYDTLEQPTVSVLYDSICTLPTPYDFGRVFTGWYTSNGVQITNGNGILLEKWQYLSDMDLYARWELKVYRITYIDGYKHNNPTSITIESPTIILNDAVREGYRFMGWYNTPDFDASYAYRVATLGIKNQVLYARWEKLYTISFNTNGGSSVSSFTGIKGEQFILPTSYKDGYDGSWGNYGFGDSFTVAGSMTLTAVWTGKYYTITFDNNGGSGGTVSAQVQYNGSMPDIDLPTCAGHKLDYFYDSDNNKYYVNANYDERAYTFTRNITLTAHWSEAFLIIENLGKSDGGWKIRITNWSSTLVMVNYNKLMCNFGDAQNWTGLKDISSFQLYPEISAEVVIKGNWFATSVTFSYVAGNYRYITYADGLNADGSINVRYNKISI